MWPILSWACQYVWLHKGTSGIVGAFAVGTVQSLLDWTNMLLSNPLHTVIYLAFLGILGRLAWPKSARR